MRARFWSVCLILVAGAPLFADLNYVTNGGFENGATNGELSHSIGGDLIYVFGVGGATNIDGWTVSASSNSNGSSNPLSVDVTGNPPQVPASGQYALDFDPFWNVQTGALLAGPVVGTLPQVSQSFFLPTGQYVLSFDGAVEQQGGTGTRPLNVTLTGAASLNQTVTTSQIDSTGYTLFTFDFDSTGGNVDLTFTPNDYSPEPNFMLDNVSVTAATPEPSYFLVVGLGLIGLASFARFRRANRSEADRESRV